MATTTLALTGFLLARIDEEEEMWTMARGAGLVVAANGTSAIPPRSWTERRVAECEAKRRIVTEHPWDEYDICTSNDAMGHLEPIASCPVLRLLAAVYADHQDYREEWKP